MHPLVLRKEVDGFIANRLQEAVFRETLCLLHDVSAMVQEVDDADRYSFTLRRAGMGPIQSYRIIVAETSASAMERFGPELKVPWTKLTEVTKITDTFLDKLAEQSDAHRFEHPRARTEATATASWPCCGAERRGLQRGRDAYTLGQGLRECASQIDDGSGPLRGCKR